MPLLTPPPGGGGTHTTGAGGVPHSPGGGVFVGAGALTLPHPAIVVRTRVPSPGPIPPTTRPARVVRFDQSRNASVFQTPLIAAKINVAGGVLPPWVLRRDYQRGGLVYRVVPFLKEPPPPVAGGIQSPLVLRWDRWRDGVVYLMRPLLVPPPPILEGNTWISFFSEARDLEWFSWNRALQWEPGMATYLTKRTAESRQYVMDFSELPEVKNASVASVTGVVSTPLTVGANNLTIGAFNVGSNGKTATVWISGGQAGASYQIAFTVTVAGGTVLEEFGYLLVEDE